MRGIASYLAGLLTLVALLAAGGAWAPQYSVAFEPVFLPSEAASLRMLEEFESIVDDGATDSRAVAGRVIVPQGCIGPYPGAVCVHPVDVHANSDRFTLDGLVPAPPYERGDWLPLIAAFFEDRHIQRAQRILWCESTGDPLAKNPRSTASGLFQHLGSLWPERSVDSGWEDADVFDPVANIAVAAWLVYEGGGWSHWDASRNCWSGS